MRWVEDTRTLYLRRNDLRYGATSTARPKPTDLKAAVLQRFLIAVQVRYNSGGEVFVMKDRQHPEACYTIWPEEADEVSHDQ